MERSIYLENVPPGEALARWLTLCRSQGVVFPVAVETVKTGEAAGRVTAEAVFAKVSSPPFHSSAMDGVAVLAADTYGASESRPVRLRLGVEVEFIDTGEPLPERFDAVIMVEDLSEVGPGVFEIVRPAVPWQNVRPLGEDMVKTELIVPGGHVIRPVDIGAVLNGGHTEIAVRRKPVIAIIPTGSELVESPDELGRGRVMESNSRTIAAFVASLGAAPERMGLVPDERPAITASLSEALERADAVVVNAGTSAGREDFTRSIIEEMGSIAVHGVAMRPGKPVILGAARGRPVVGLPGFPVANYRAAEEFLRPLVSWFLGVPGRSPETMRARIARKVFSAPGVDEFIQVKVGRVAGETVAVPLPRGSGVSMSLVRSDGVVRVPAWVEGLSRWDLVDVAMHEPLRDIDGTILAIGSHDISLDLLADRIRRRDARLSLASANVGSMGGIMAIKQGQAHVAGTHLLDPETGQFNVPYVRRQIDAGDVRLVHLAWRTQGFLVRPGNPKRIRGTEDLARRDVRFMNRQRGSGTRLLLDHMLGQAGIEPSSVCGYEREVFTHTAVAAAVAGGGADAGLGVLAAARALGLDFVPVARERYDLLVLGSFVDTPGYDAVIEALEDREYRKQVEELGGYDLSEAGKEIPVE